MNGQNQTYLCIREVGTEYLLQPAGQESKTSVAGKTDNVWYFITTRPLAAFNFLGSFGAYATCRPPSAPWRWWIL